MTLLNDLKWAWTMFRIRRERRRMLFSERERYDQALRPPIGGGKVIAYPSAFYYISQRDVNRARVAGARCREQKVV